MTRGSDTEQRIAVVGAGVAGLACARALSRRGLAVEVFDKARGCGGRMSSRHRGNLGFDHGAQYFTARSPAFAAEVARWEAAGAVGRWSGRERGAEPREPRFVGTPRMSAVGRQLAAGLTLRLQRRVAALEREAGTWQLSFEDGPRVGGFSHVVLALPAPQAVALLPAGSALAGRLAEVEIEPCWAVLLAWTQPLELGFDAARLADGPLAWAARNASKPGRGEAECWVLHGAPGWSRAHLEDPPQRVVEALRGAFADCASRVLPTPCHADAHRWRYALVTRPLGEPFLEDEEVGLAVCGDGCLGGRVEAAWTSGDALGRAWADRLPR